MDAFLRNETTSGRVMDFLDEGYMIGITPVRPGVSPILPARCQVRLKLDMNLS